MLSVSDNFKSDIFNLFIEYFEECAIYFVYLANMNSLERILKQLINLIDSTRVRHKSLIFINDFC
jgi:hypothetical protein